MATMSKTRYQVKECEHLPQQFLSLRLRTPYKNSLQQLIFCHNENGSRKHEDSREEDPLQEMKTHC